MIGRGIASFTQEIVSESRGERNRNNAQSIQRRSEEAGAATLN